MAISIHDVAKKAKVSSTTVSRALNNHPYVSEKTKERIFKAMEELNYYPNTIAQQLRGQRTNMIGVTISYIINPFFAYLVDAIEKRVTELGYHLVILQTMGNPQTEQYYLDLIAKKQLDGIIMTSLEEITPKVQGLMEQKKIVICNRYLGQQVVDTVRIDEEEASYQGTKYLIEQGHTRIAYCTGNSYLRDQTDRRFLGFSKALREANIPFDESLFFGDILGIEGGRTFIQRYVALNGKRPTAVFSNGDTVAAAMIAEAKQHDIRIPEDLAILGFDDQPMAQFITPSLTTIQQPIQEMGALAADILIASLEGREIPTYRTLEAPLIIRDSV